MSAPNFVQSVVKTCLRIGKDDRVLISAWSHTLDLAEAFTVECRRAGAKTLTEFSSDTIFYDNVLNGPLDILKSTNPFDLALADTATANIFIPGPEDPEKLKEISPERSNAMSVADRPFYDKFLANKIRTAHILAGYVTPQRARTYGFNFDSWKRSIDEATDVDYEDMRKLGKKLAKVMEDGQEVNITAPGGTNLRLALEGRHAHVDDGVIDEEDIEKGVIFTSIPGGVVQVAPTETSARGTFVSDVPEQMLGFSVHKAAWKFKDGRLTSFTGGKNVDKVVAIWKKAKGDKDKIGWLTIGLNPMAKTGFIHSEIVQGAVTVGIGDNRELDGKNETDFGCKFTATEPTIVVDGETIIKHGRVTF